ncbi:AbiV family abortive infection protein [Glycomyces xiaoerkulensis]|uniref:AbiV family abortive infection protein n=1 Tax=Glycomyces xiaoerkulensis TaxID=2038139 RepID=UPI000C25C185|nr:AbiV family abortive infection protein [Glycomyces xiaoerkulensis]
MAIRKLPDLTPEQVVQLQDALLENANALLTSALALLDQGQVALARSLAVLGLEESGKAIAIHERRVAIVSAPEGEPFRCDDLDQLWASHEQKLHKVYYFLLEEPYWFDREPPDSGRNAAQLGTIKSWARRHDRWKLRGFYVDLDKLGNVKMPTDADDKTTLREVIERVHQIGWQLRLGEHIEGQQQDEREAGFPPLSDESLEWLDANAKNIDGSPNEFHQSLRQGVPGQSLSNAAYRFNLPGSDQNPFPNFGKPGYEAETIELIALAEELGQEDSE